MSWSNFLLLHIIDFPPISIPNRSSPSLLPTALAWDLVQPCQLRQKVHGNVEHAYLHPSMFSPTVSFTAHLLASVNDCVLSGVHVAPKQLASMAFCRLSSFHPKT